MFKITPVHAASNNFIITANCIVYTRLSTQLRPLLKGLDPESARKAGLRLLLINWSNYTATLTLCIHEAKTAVANVYTHR